MGETRPEAFQRWQSSAEVVGGKVQSSQVVAVAKLSRERTSKEIVVQAQRAKLI